MPGLSGQELTTEIRKFNKSTPILFYSGAAYDEDKREARNAGAQGYLTKPAGISELVDEVGKLIAEARIAFPVAVNLNKRMCWWTDCLVALRYTCFPFLVFFCVSGRASQYRTLILQTLCGSLPDVFVLILEQLLKHSARFDCLNLPQPLRHS